ncbi:MAG: response regulator, partial [Bacteroidota bacterium]
MTKVKEGKSLNKEKTQYRILIVEDEASIRDMLQLNLELEGYAVVVASNGPRALEMARTHRLNLILLDVMLPGVDGFAVCNTLRLEGNLTPILFLSAKNTPEERVEGLKLGGDDYMGKPFNLEELLIRITKLISRRDAEQATLADLMDYQFSGGKINFKTFEIT